jgi:two-component system, sensor histidine kinase PdtaS
MRGFLRFFKCLHFTLLLVVGGIDAVGQSDSLSLVQGVDEAEAMLEVDFPKAMKYCLELNKMAMSSTCQPCKARTLIMLGKAYWVNGQYSESVDFLKQGIKIAKRASDSTQWAKAANIIGNNFYYQAYYDSAIFYFQQSYSVYEDIGDKAGMANVLGDIFLMYNRKGDYAKSVEYLIKSDEISDEQTATREMGNFPGMAGLFPDSLYFREKISDNLRELNMQLKKNNPEAVYKIYLNLGVAYNQVKEYAVAARYYVKSYTIQEKLGLIPLWFYAGMNYREANMKDSCFYYHKQAMKDFKRTTQLHILYIYELLGDAHFHFGQYDSARYNYEIAMKMNTQCNNRITMAGLHRRLAEVYTNLKRYDEAEHHIQEGIVLAKEVAMAHRRNLYKSAAQLYSLTGDYKKAFYFQSQYINLADSLARMETALNLTRLLAQYKTAKKVRELELLKTASERDELVLRNRNVTILSLAVATLVSIGIISMFAWQRNKIKKKNTALALANTEQAALMKEVHHRVKNNLQLMASLINLKTRQTTSIEAQEALQQLSGRIFSMGLIHEKLYQNENIHTIRLDEYLKEVSQHSLSSLEAKEHPISLRMDCLPVEVDVDKALNCGLIANELVTNAVKYAFAANQQYREIVVDLRKNGSNITFGISDNGSKSSFISDNFKKSFGSRFVDQLVTTKLGGEWSVKVEGGVQVAIKFTSTLNGIGKN